MVAFVTFALVVLFFTILVLIGKANELSEDLAGKGMNYDSKQMEWLFPFDVRYTFLHKHSISSKIIGTYYDT